MYYKAMLSRIYKGLLNRNLGKKIDQLEKWTKDLNGQFIEKLSIYMQNMFKLPVIKEMHYEIKTVKYHFLPIIWLKVLNV